ncbi:MAG: DUF2442 domain-containing protein [Roseiarcus sp.]
MADVLEAELDAADERGAELAVRAPRAQSARIDVGARRIVLELNNGCAYAFPVALVEDLRTVRDADLADVVIDGAGFNLAWPALGVDLFVPGLVAGIFGARRWMESDRVRAAE